jgi:hypothetical protein
VYDLSVIGQWRNTMNRRLDTGLIALHARRILVLAAFVAVVSALAFPAEGRAEDVICGPANHPYRCGAILVILVEDTTDQIGEVITRHDGDPGTDVLVEFTAVRDLLDPSGVAEDLSPATVYQIRVPIGTEEQAAGQYAADPAVYAASVDRETIGRLTPDAAMPAAKVTFGNGAFVGSGIVLLLAAVFVGAHRARRST